MSPRDVERMIWALIGNGTLIAIAISPLSIKGIEVIVRLFA